ncbi:hypothetical protein ACWGJ2_36695 [Streptomyces sp. NPDC054796]
MRRTALTHLADHARRNPLPQHLRTCRCPDNNCAWHPRHRGCDGPILLTLTRHHCSWRLADLCHACAAHTPHTAPVNELPARPPLPVAEQDPYDRIENTVWDTTETATW